MRYLTIGSSETVDIHGNIFMNGMFATEDNILAEELLKVSYVSEIKEQEEEPIKPKTKK